MTAHRPTRLLAALAVAATPFAQAAKTDIADEPLITQAEFKPKPNLLVVLDDSGSMRNAHMPDELESGSWWVPRYNWLGFYASQCNGVAYDPNYTYTPPLKADGTSYPAARFDAAYPDGFIPGDWHGGDVTNKTINLAEKSWLKKSDSQWEIYLRDAQPTIPIAVKLPAQGQNATSFSISSNSTSGVLVGVNSFPPNTKVVLEAKYDHKVGSTTYENKTLAITGTVDTWVYAAATKEGTLHLKDITSKSDNGNGTGIINGTVTKIDWTIKPTGQHYYTYAGKQPRLTWKYESDGKLIKNDFSNECKIDITKREWSGNAVFELHLITDKSSAAAKQNYANWASYYRTRQLLMRTALGNAFDPLDANYRVGLMTLNRQGPSGATDHIIYEPVKDFDSTQKIAFYRALHTAGLPGGTPLRRALSDAGKYYARRFTDTAKNQKNDPMQYACQRNFALLTTDGYWNGASGKSLENADIAELASVADHYYQSDLRTDDPNTCTSWDTGKDVCTNILSPVGKDDAKHQHLTTFSIGMGVSGSVPLTNDEEVIKNIAWPTPEADKPTAVDDLWHAAIKGRGQYYSAQNAEQLTTAIQSIVTAIQDVTGAGSATATSTLDLVQGDGNIAFEASYTTGAWYGDLLARELDSRTAEVKPGDPQWSARERLDAKSAASRKIYFKNGSALGEFTWGNLPSALQAHFKDLCASPAKLTQCATLSTTHQTTVNGGAELVSYLRGDRTKEAKSTNTTAPLFRERKSVLGDIINSKPIHVGKPPFDYADTGYATFKTSNLTRKKMVYVGANDGMLHALDAATGEELWAYVPTAVMPNLYKLADVKYGSNTSQPHTYFVDGKTVQGDVKIGGVWKTILVGGLNKGGRAYYALDITDPENPQALWEFAHDDSTVHNNLGLTYSDPVISKLNDGTWTVAFGSGYNNVSPGDGKGRLFVVNAATGAILRNIATTAGGTTTPSGLSKINVWVKALNDNTAQRFYAGDLLGNVWRFDVDDKVLPHKAAMQLAQLQDASGTPQPITTEPKLREYDKQPVIVVATGRYLGRDDIDDTQVQSVAAIRDPLTATGWGAVRTNTAKFKKVTITKSGTTASGAAVTVDWATDGGWWADFPTSGERVAMPMEWDGARLLAATTLPSGDQCKSGGASWLYSFGLAGGKTDAEQFSEDTLIVGFSVVTNDEGQPKILVRTSGNETQVKDGTGLGGGTTIKRARRVSWRELP